MQLHASTWQLPCGSQRRPAYAGTLQRCVLTVQPFKLP